MIFHLFRCCLGYNHVQCRHCKIKKIIPIFNLFIFLILAQGDLIPRHQQVFSTNQFFSGVRIPDPENMVRAASSCTSLPSPSFAVHFFPVQKLCPLLCQCAPEYYLEVAEPVPHDISTSSLCKSSQKMFNLCCFPPFLVAHPQCCQASEHTE